MSILRTRNKNTNQWEEIQAIKGPQGPQGIQGPEGPKGDDYEITQEDYQEIANVVETDIQPTLNNKVDKIEGKGLSTNDFTDAYKTKVDNNTAARHTHSNLDTINSISSTDISNWNAKADPEDIPDVSHFITKTVNDLVNYYKKTETYTKTEVNNLIGSIQQFHYEIVQTLPATGENNILYLVPRTESEQSNIYDEYVYANNSWEKIGSTDIDLSGYVTTSDLNTALANYTTTTDLNTLLTDYVKFTDYGTSSKGGVVKSGYNGFNVNPTAGSVWTSTYTDAQYDTIGASNFIGKGTLDNIIAGRLVKKTDYATNDTGGVVKTGSFGFKTNANGVGYIQKASESNINAKVSDYYAIVPSNLDYAVKKSITTNTLSMTDTEKETAQNWLGIDEIVADAKGTNIELKDSKAKKVENITLYGKSSQNVNTGSNLLQMTDSNYFFANNTIIRFDTTCFLENNGATISFPDGSGTSSTNSRFLVYDLSTICNLQVGSWYSITVEGGQYSGFGVNLAEYPQNPADIYDRTKTITGGRNFSWTWKVEADKKYMVEFRSPTNGEGASMWRDNPFKIDIMVNAGKPKSFEAFTNKVATPSIASPSAITDITSESVEITDGTNTQTATLNLTARGIPVKSGGNYTDETGQEWICDTIDKNTGKYTQRVYRQTLPNSFSKSNASGNFLLTVSNLDYAPKLPSGQYAISYDVMCNQFKNDTTWISQNGYVVVDGTKVSFADATEFNTYFTEHPLIYEYVLDTPIETDLTSAQLEQLDLATYNGETEITSNIPLDISYIADAKKYVDENIESSLKERDKWSLITEYYVNEAITTPIDWSSDTEMYDDILVVAENLLGGETQSAFAVSCKLSNSNDYFAINQSNILQPSTVRTAIVEVTRYLPSKWRFEKKGTYASTILGDVSSTAIPNDTPYEHKIKAVKVYTASGSNFTTGTIKLYGRKRF